ncbi:MAG: hypothetical protein U0746_00280 [Gemmataceae bacterium]
MPMPPYPIRCYTEGCNRRAVFKIAARWTDGVTWELKTYGLACEACLAKWYRNALERQAACRLVSGEKLDTPGIYTVTRGARDQQLERLTDLEAQIANSVSA